ncbi:unnamed protein product [Anisakis simplex]|uniref:Dally-like (inferred by orthology to a D. melanogaster protein) n=1 Tax=Anisakis simplex TaxID=6269 RepID=A0A0M3JA23_ANISI|nr:unnamed protein product [Anisakis simplex]
MIIIAQYAFKNVDDKTLISLSDINKLRLNKKLTDRNSDTLTKLANRLKGPYNVISVVVPIGVQISESIMLFQENDHQISAKVIQKCFKNSNKQLIKKRDIDKSQLSPNITITSTQLQLSEPNSSVNTQMMISFIDRLATTRGFWRSLSKSICIDGEWAESASGDVPCWNGTHLSDYNRPLVGDGIRNQMLNPEFDSSNNLSSGS